VKLSQLFCYSVSLQSNNDQLFVFSFPCGEAYMAWSSDLRHQHNQVWTFRKIYNRFGISFRFSKSLSESQKTQGKCPNMENVTRHVVLNFRVSIHAWRGSTVSKQNFLRHIVSGWALIGKQKVMWGGGGLMSVTWIFSLSHTVTPIISSSLTSLIWSNSNFSSCNPFLTWPSVTDVRQFNY